MRTCVGPAPESEFTAPNGEYDDCGAETQFDFRKV